MLMFRWGYLDRSVVREQGASELDEEAIDGKERARYQAKANDDAPLSPV